MQDTTQSNPESENKIATVLHEAKEGTLHSGSKTGPLVESREQAIAIALSEQRKAVKKTAKKSKKKTTKKKVVKKKSAKKKVTKNKHTTKPSVDELKLYINKRKEAAKPANPVDAFQTVEGEDLTGRNFALETFKKIQKQILETYSLLSNEQDREIFYDYLITNTRLYFDKFEDELQTMVAEPTTPEYEEEKKNKEMSSSPETGAEETTEELPPPTEEV